MASSSVVFKVFLKSNGSPEARKFIIDDASNITSYLFVKEKIRAVFGQLRNAPFRITWKDADGDDITVQNDEDLIIAFTEMAGPVKTLYVSISSRSPSPQNPTSNVLCDNCNKIVTGYRYKCLQCPDFDLCIDCEHAGLHSEHYMLRTANGELPFSGTCKRISETINKSIRRFQGKEACKAAKASRNFERRHDHHHYRHHEEAGDIGWRQETQPGSSRMTGCPMPNIVHDFASAAASAAAQAMSGIPTAQEETAKTQQQTNEQPQQQDIPHPNFVDIMVKALHNIFGEQPGFPANPNPQSTNQDAKTPTSTPVDTPQHEQTPTDATPMEEDAEAMRRTPRRGSWTMLDNDISIQNTPMAQQTQVPIQQVPIQQVPIQQVPIQQVPIQQPTYQQPSAPPLDPKIAEALRKLQEMGFGNPDYLVELLKRFDGKIDLAIKYMFDNRT